MVRRTDRLPVTALAVTIALSGCTQAVKAGLGLLGLSGDQTQAETVGAEGSVAQGSGGAQPKRPAHAVTSTYESVPAFWWEHAMAPVAVPGRFLSRKIGEESCFLSSPGLSRVLPIPDGAPVWPVLQGGFFTVGVAGPGTDAARNLWAMNGMGLAQAAVRRTAQAGTYGICSRSLFLFVSLGTGQAYEPVLVR